jgi:short-subunit dehydrogenase
MGVNVWGVIHGIRTFVPILLKQDEPGHVINTASMAALTSMPYSGIYFMTKHAVMSLSETLYHELTLRGAKVGVSVVCPEVVATNIDKSERTRPEALRSGEERSEERIVVEAALSKGVLTGVPPAWIADRAVAAIGEGRFYVLSEDEWRRTAETRLEDLRLARNPTFAPPVSG